MYSEDDLLPLSAVADFVFCERRAALHRIEQVWEENVATVEGRLLHDRTHQAGAESRGDVRIVRSLRLRSLQLGLSGVADVVEFHRVPDEPPGDSDATSLSDVPRSAVRTPRSGWQPFPVEYKRGVLRHERAFEVQVCAQALCIEEMLGVSVPAGALFYGLSRRRQDVPFDDALRRQTEEAAARLHRLFDSGVTPPALYEKKCRKCSLFDLCLPKTAGGGRSVGRYLAGI